MAIFLIVPILTFKEKINKVEAYDENLEETIEKLTRKENTKKPKVLSYADEEDEKTGNEIEHAFECAFEEVKSNLGRI